MQILNGNKIAEAILSDVKNRIEAEKIHPVLGVVLVG